MNKKLYAVYSQTFSTPEREAMMERHPNRAEYGTDFYLFCETYEQAFGSAHPNSVDLSGIILGEGGMSNEDFLAQADALIQEGHSGREIVLSVEQGRLLKQEMFPEVE